MLKNDASQLWLRQAGIAKKGGLSNNVGEMHLSEPSWNQTISVAD